VSAAPWWRRRAGWLIAAAVLIAVGAEAGYQVYVARIQHRNDVTATKVERLTKAQCGQTQLLYDFLNALAEDSSPSFGSPPEGPIVPGARARLIGRLHAAEHASTGRLRRQGCTVQTPP
jgi:hypothetical protein